MAYIIEYKINGKRYTVVERPREGWESQFLQQVLNRIESIVDGTGAVITAMNKIG